MGCVADVCQSAPHDDSGSYDGGDSEVKMIRLATGALHRPQRGVKTLSGTSSKGGSAPARDRRIAASWIGPRASMSRDGWRGSARLGFETGNLQTRQRILGLRWKQTRLRRGKEPAEAPC
jgi:hypothetical protein